MLTEGLCDRSCGVVRSPAKSGGGREWSSRRKVEEGASGRLGGADRCVEILRGRWRGQRGTGVTDGVKSWWCSHSPAAVLGEIPAVQGLGAG